MTYLTVDFHNTLVECDRWFDLEVHTLVSEVLDWGAAHAGLQTRSIDRSEVDAAYRRLRLAIHHHGHELDAISSTVAVFGRLGIEIPRPVISEAIDALMLDALECAAPVPGSQQLLESVSDQGIPIAVVSSAVHHKFLEWALERFGMRSHIAAVITSASSGYYKSRPEIYWSAIAELGGKPDVSTHLGDSLRFDVGGASQAGMQSIWFDRKDAGMEDQSDYHPNLVLTTLTNAAGPVLDLVGRPSADSNGSGS